MDLKKRRTRLRHICVQCWRAYSRAWVLKRHLVEQHGTLQNPISLSFAGRKNTSAIPITQMMMMYDMTVKSQSTNPIPSEQQIQKTIDLATEISRPIYDGAKLAVQNTENFLEKLWTNYIVFPKNLVSGFSCFYCQRCSVAESPIPIKDRGVDLTCEGRHRCPAKSEPTTPISQITPAQRSKMEMDMGNIFNQLHGYIEFWIPGKKVIVASKIDVPTGQGNGNIRNYIQELYGVPSKYHLQDLPSLDKVPWISKLLGSGKIEPTERELRDFCSYCDGTYAILQVQTRELVEYYAVYLMQDENSQIDSIFATDLGERT